MKREVLAHFKRDLFAAVFDVEYDWHVIRVISMEEVGMLSAFLCRQLHEFFVGDSFAIVHY